MCSGNMVTLQLWTALNGLIRQVFLFGSFVHMSMYVVGTVGTVLIRAVPSFQRYCSFVHISMTVQPNDNCLCLNGSELMCCQRHATNTFCLCCQWNIR